MITVGIYDKPERISRANFGLILKHKLLIKGEAIKNPQLN